jgi:hypothetical protein
VVEPEQQAWQTALKPVTDSKRTRPRAISADVLLVAADRDTVRCLSEEIRRQENRA